MSIKGLAVNLCDAADELSWTLETFRAIEAAMTYGPDEVSVYALTQPMNHFIDLSQKLVFLSKQLHEQLGGNSGNYEETVG